jgi:hypothetical protein
MKYIPGSRIQIVNNKNFPAGLLPNIKRNERYILHNIKPIYNEENKIDHVIYSFKQMTQPNMPLVFVEEKMESCEKADIIFDKALGVQQTSINTEMSPEEIKAKKLENIRRTPGSIISGRARSVGRSRSGGMGR